MCELDSTQEGLVNSENIEDHIDDIWGGRGLTAYKNLAPHIVNTNEIVVVFDEEMEQLENIN